MDDFLVSRKWHKAANGEPPCCGHYTYTVWVNDYKEVDNLTEKEYNSWKEYTIIEDWKL